MRERHLTIDLDILHRELADQVLAKVDDYLSAGRLMMSKAGFVSVTRTGGASEAMSFADGHGKVFVPTDFWVC